MSRFPAAPVTLSASAVTLSPAHGSRCKVEALWKAFHHCLLEMWVQVNIKMVFFHLACKMTNKILVCAAFETVCFSALKDEVLVFYFE